RNNPCTTIANYYQPQNIPPLTILFCHRKIFRECLMSSVEDIEEIRNFETYSTSSSKFSVKIGRSRKHVCPIPPNISDEYNRYDTFKQENHIPKMHNFCAISGATINAGSISRRESIDKSIETPYFKNIILCKKFVYNNYNSNDPLMKIKEVPDMIIKNFICIYKPHKTTNES
ncbi:piggyBac transposable element-derived protein 4-like, partial [Vespula squamosa]